MKRANVFCKSAGFNPSLLVRKVHTMNVLIFPEIDFTKWVCKKTYVGEKVFNLMLKNPEKRSYLFESQKNEEIDCYLYRRFSSGFCY